MAFRANVYLLDVVLKNVRNKGVNEPVQNREDLNKECFQTLKQFPCQISPLVLRNPHPTVVNV
jgi:hypothetical protein